MSVSIPDFWRLAVESRLLAPGDCQQLEANFAGVKGASSQSNAATLGEWLVANGVLTRYQIQTLLAGRAGPFYYGDYFVYDRIRSKEGRLTGLLRAMHVPTRHPVMLYAITGAAARDPQWWAVAAQQVAWACSVGHPFVSQCYELLDLGKHKVVAIEDLLGDPAPGVERAPGDADNTLAARFTDGNRLAPGDACRLAYQLGLGLARLHQLGQVHGSIRPDNVWLQADGTCKLLQTPLAPEPAMGPGPIDWNAPDPNGQALLSADYAAPELAQLGRPPDMLCDVYALGATLYRMLSGWAPFPGGDVASKLSRHASESPASLEQFGVPQQLAQMVGFLLAKDPAGRYQSAAQVAEALAYFVDPAVQSYLPQPAATAAVFDQWLESQPRLPGMAPGAIPTASSLAAYSAAQYAAAQDAAAQYAAQAAMQSYAPPVAAAAPPPQPPAEHAPSFYESLQPNAPSFDPTSFASNEPAHADQPAYSQWGAAAAAGGAAVAESMPSVGVAASSSPAGLNLDAVLDASPKPARAKSRRTSGSAAPKAKKMSPVVLAGLGGGLAVVLVVVGVIVSKALSGGSSDDGSQVVINTQHGGSTPDTGNGPIDKNKAKVTPEPGKTPDSSKGDSGTRPVKPPPAASDGPEKTPVQSVADDGVSLWASPTAGNPLPLDYVASGAQLILAVRPANIVQRPEGDQLLPSLGPWGDMAAHAIKDATGLETNQITQVLLIVHDSGDGKPVSTAIIRTSEKITPEERLTAWGNPTPTTDGDATYYQGASLSYFLPAKEGGKLLVVGPAAQIKEIVHPADGPPAMARALELILPHTDADRDVTLVFVPSYLSGDGQSVLSGSLAALRKPLEAFFGSDVNAALLSLHFQANFFLELRAIGAPDKDASTLSDDLNRKIKAIPTGIENDLDALNLHPYGRKLLRRLPEWMRLMTEYTRSGVEDDQPVLRCYLPSVAAPNLLMGTELALAEQSSLGGPAVVAGGPKKPQTIAELLKKKTTLTFPRDTLEKSLQLLFEDLGVKYEILGTDMQLEGITKNQSFGLDEHDKPAEEILQKIMHLANPDGKLVYVIKPKAPGGPEMLFITTRAAVAKRGDKLPPGLEAGPAKPTPTKKK
jgi:serine/threonine-protein kinase